MLDTAAKFHSYRGNLLLIGPQAPSPQATRVAGFRTWQSLGRQVRKGERGIAILAPCTYDQVDVGAQQIAVHRKGSGRLQWPPASSDAFVWLRLYQQHQPRPAGQRALWLT